MSSITYDEVFGAFLGKITDFDFVKFEEEDVYALMGDWLRSTIATSYVRRLFSAITLDDENKNIDFTMLDVVDENADIDFVREILAKGMVIAWLKPQVRSKLNISQFFATKEQKMFSQANHLEEIRALLEDTELELRKEIRDRGYINNGYLDAT